MKFHSPSSILGAVLALAAALFLSSCGGGGAQGNPNVTGAVTILPATGTVFAGVPFTFTVQGGRTPYTITTDQPGLMPVPAQIDGHSFTVVAANPGVIDKGIAAGDLPVRSVTISVRSGDGIVASTTGVQVAQNFLTGYGVSFSPVTCPIQNPPQSVQACGGGETTVTLQATFNGNLAAARQFQFQVVKGHFSFVFPGGGTGNTVTTVSDHSGTVTTILAIDANAPTEIGVLRVIDVATGVYVDHAFIINGKTTGNGGALTVLPSQFSFAGNLTTDCGGGTGTFSVFNGTPPFTAVASDPRITLANTTSSTDPGVFTFSVPATPTPCITGSIVVNDPAGDRASVDVATVAGATSPPTPAKFTVAPDTLTLGCGQSGSVSVVGGSGSFITNSGSPNITAVVSGNTVTITRLNSGTNAAADTPVSVTDGSDVGVVTVTSPLTCP